MVKENSHTKFKGRKQYQIYKIEDFKRFTYKT